MHHPTFWYTGSYRPWPQSPSHLLLSFSIYLEEDQDLPAGWKGLFCHSWWKSIHDSRSCRYESLIDQNQLQELHSGHDRSIGLAVLKVSQLFGKKILYPWI